MSPRGPAAWAVRHRAAVLFLSAGLIVSGLLALGSVRLDLLPALSAPAIRVRERVPGLTVALMEDRATRPLERAVAGLPGIERLESVTGPDALRLDARFAYARDPRAVRRAVTSAIERVRPALPPGADRPVISVYDAARRPVMQLMVTSTRRGIAGLDAWVWDNLAKPLRDLPGAGTVALRGRPAREILVVPAVKRLTGLGLSVNDVVRALRRADTVRPRSPLTLADESDRGAPTAATVAAVPLRLPGGEGIPLSEVARIEERLLPREWVRYNGVPAIAVSVFKTPGASAVDVAHEATVRLAWLKANGLVPSDVRLHTVFDQSAYVRQALGRLAATAALGALIAVALAYAFLADAAGAFMAGLSIPIVAGVVLALLDAVGVPLNLATLEGLVLGLGLWVAQAAAVRAVAVPRGELDAGTRSTALAAVMPLVVALPASVLGGPFGALMRPVAATYVAGLAVSWWTAFAVVPALSARASSRRFPPPGAATRLTAAYRGALAGLLRRPLGCLALVAVALGAGGLATRWMVDRQTLLPRLDDGRALIRVSPLSGMSAAAMDRHMAVIEKLARAQHGVTSAITLARRSGAVDELPRGRITVQLGPHVDGERWIGRFEHSLTHAVPDNVAVRAHLEQAADIPRDRVRDVVVRFSGPDGARLDALGAGAAQRLATVPGLRDVRFSAQARLPELVLRVDPERASSLGIEVTDVSRALRTALGGLIVHDVTRGKVAYDIRVRLPRADVRGPDALGRVPLLGELRDRPVVDIGDIARLSWRTAPAEIRHVDGQRVVDVRATVDGDPPLAALLARVRRVLHDPGLPRGYEQDFGGVALGLWQARRWGVAASATALLLAFLALALRYRGWRTPLAVILGAAPALAGAATALWLLGLPWSIPAWLGVMLLLGIVFGSGVLLAEEAGRCRGEGLASADAVIQAGPRCARAMLMSALVPLGALLPLAWNLGLAGALFRPLAVAMAGGLVIAPWTNLFVVPALFGLIGAGRPPDSSQEKLSATTPAASMAAP